MCYAMSGKQAASAIAPFALCSRLLVLDETIDERESLVDFSQARARELSRYLP
jgi:hypothetical protein